MAFFSSRLVGREYVAHETLAVTLERPDGFEFSVGQYVDTTLPELHYTDDLGPTRSFSIASAPGDRDLLLVMRMRPSAFKRTLVELPLGSPVRMEGPIDDLSLQIGGDRPVALLAGGVGVAPFLSGLREAAARGMPCNVTLFYSNPRPEDAAYLEDLRDLTHRLPGFRFVPTMTRMSDSARTWAGETGRVGVAMIERHLPALRGPRYYISGTPGFISALRQQLQRAAVPPPDIDIEMYTGY